MEVPRGRAASGQAAGGSCPPGQRPAQQCPVRVAGGFHSRQQFIQREALPQRDLTISQKGLCHSSPLWPQADVFEDLSTFHSWWICVCVCISG